QVSDQKRGKSGLASSSSIFAARSGFATKARSSSIRGTRPIRSRLARRRNSESSQSGAGRTPVPSHFRARSPSMPGSEAPPQSSAARTRLILEVILLRLFLEPVDFRQDRLDLALRRGLQGESRGRLVEVPVDPAPQAVVAADRKRLLHGALDLELAVARGEDLPQLRILDLLAPHRDDLEPAVLLLGGADGVLDLAVHLLGDLGEDAVLAVGVLRQGLPDLRGDDLRGIGFLAADVDVEQRQD